MSSFETSISRKLPLVSLISAIFIIYTNIAWIPWELSFLSKSEYFGFFAFFTYRFLFFLTFIYLLLRYNLGKLQTSLFTKRLWKNFLFSFIAYLFYATISFGISFCTRKTDCMGSNLIFQFFVTCLLCTFIGYISMLFTKQREKEQEIEKLRIESLQSRCDALANQINPHFFFNALNGISSLIRKKNDEHTLSYVTKLSDIFRYILQSDKRGLVALKEELMFIEAFRHVMEVRFANKLTFTIDIPEDKWNLRIPVLSLLPLVENATVHNIIDSDHRMDIRIELNERMELVVTNPIYPKLTPPDTNGTGLKNLENRFLLLMDKQIRVESDEQMFKVYLPLK